MEFFELLQQIQRVRIVTARTRLAVQPRHRFEVVIHDLRRRLGEDLQGELRASPEIGDENFQHGIRRNLANGTDAVDEMLRAAVAQIVAIHARDHHIGQIQP